MLSWLFGFIEKVYTRNYITGKTQKGPALFNSISGPCGKSTGLTWGCLDSPRDSNRYLLVAVHSDISSE